MRIGIDLGGTKIEAILLDRSAERARVRIPTPRDDYPATLQAIGRLVADLDARSGATASVGVGIPGTIDPVTHLVKNANSIWLIGRPLQTDLEALLARPVRIDNDANCFAVSEAADGAARSASVVFGVIVGTGTGAGIVVGGRSLRGVNAVAGEWGHNPLPWPDTGEWPGPPCYCGRSGCIETFLSGPGFARDYARQAGQALDPPAIVRAADAGDPAAAAALERYEHRMARALASVINVLDPEVIVLGGGMSNVERLYRHVPRRWGEYVFGATAVNPTLAEKADRSVIVRTRLVRAQHGDASGVRGAAWLWADDDGRAQGTGGGGIR